MNKDYGRKELKDLKVILCGQLVTSRTETLEEYLRERVDTLAVIGITSPFARQNLSRCTLYKKGKLIREFKLFSFQVVNAEGFRKPLLLFSFFIYFITICCSVIKLKEKFDLFIGIACASGFAGVFLKLAKSVKYAIYYSIDFYPLPKHFSFTYLGNRAIWFLDKICVRFSDLNWDLSIRIAQARYRYAKISPDTYHHLVAPLAYSAKCKRFRPLEEIERYTLGFVGTISINQGLQLLIKAMPRILKEMPQVKTRIIGQGPYEREIKKMVEAVNLNGYFIFHGFVKDDNKMLEILSSCAIGVAPWICSGDDNALYADPGKPKLYAFCGLPIVITNGTLIAKEIEEKKAGISINYDENELSDAIVSLLQDDNKLKEYKKNAYEFAGDYTADKIFDSVFQKSLSYLN